MALKAEVKVIKRLGPVPFWRGERRCVEQLEEIYRKAMECAQSALSRNAERR